MLSEYSKQRIRLFASLNVCFLEKREVGDNSTDRLVHLQVSTRRPGTRGSHRQLQTLPHSDDYRRNRNASVLHFGSDKFSEFPPFHMRFLLIWSPL